jgi:DNA-binding CsgD family transcriptional regulator/tetratricopeptide (TPR) repeat protein
MAQECGSPLARVAARLDRARSAGEPSALILRGDGDALLREAIALAHAHGFRVVHASGRESDRWTAHAGLTALLSDDRDRFAELAEVQADALRGALGGDRTVTPTPVAVQAASLSMLGLLSEDVPLLVAIDEGQWLDESSARAVLFAIRRLVAEAVVVLVAVGAGGHDVFVETGLEELDVGGESGRSAAGGATTVERDPVGRADELEAAARRARAKGALIEAQGAWCEAARLSADGEAAARRLLEAASDLSLVGSVDAAIERFALATERAAGHPSLLAQISLLAGQAIGWHRSPIEAVGCLHTAAIHAPDETTSSMCLAHAAMFSSIAGNITHALDLSARAEALAPSTDLTATVLATAVRGWQLLLAGHPDAIERLNPITTLARFAVATGGPEELTLAQLAGLALVIAERWQEAEPLLETVVRRARPAGWQAASAFASASLALMRWRQGDWDAAYATALGGVEDAVGGDVARGWAQAFLAQITAAMGREAETRRAAGEALRIGEPSGAAALSFAARAALGHLELSLGNVDSALVHLDVLAARVVAAGLGEPGFLWWEADHIEALVMAGRDGDCASALQRLDDAAARTGRLWASGVVARARAMQANGPEAERWFAEALGLHDRLGSPFERARTLLRRGQARLARRATAAGRADLGEARGGFERLGAAVWAAQASASRRDVHWSAAGRPADRLTQAELRVAVSAAHGRRNREIAAELYLSAKTVDHHLQSIYRKLAVRSRTELAVLLTSSAPGSASLTLTA